MLRIGNHVPAFRALGLVEGELSWLNSWQLIAGKWTAFCFVPRLSLAHQGFLIDYSRSFRETGAHLIIVSRQQGNLCNSWPTPAQRSQLIILDDPLQRLSRMFSAADQTRDRCTTFVIDPNGVLQIPLIHDLNGRGLDAVQELVRAYQRQDIMSRPHAGEHVREDASKPLSGGRLDEETSSPLQADTIREEREEVGTRVGHNRESIERAGDLPARV